MNLIKGSTIINEFRRIIGVILLCTIGALTASAQKPGSINSRINDTIVKPVETSKPYSAKSDEQLFAIEDSVIMEKSKRRGSILEDSAMEQQGLTLLSDSTMKMVKEEGHSPKKAMIYSIILPGLGQAYNNKYWKIPIVYAALGTAGYLIYYNTNEYRLARDAYILDTSDLNERYLRYWRRNMELSYISLVLVDALVVVDAYVDAHLFYWDVSPDLSIRMEPSIRPVLDPSGTIGNNYGFRCSFTF